MDKIPKDNEAIEQAITALVEEHIDLAVKVTNYFISSHRFLLYDDVYSEALYGLLQAANSYNDNSYNDNSYNDNSCSFKTFARDRIYGAIIDYYRGLDGYSRKYGQQYKFLSIDGISIQHDADILKKLIVKEEYDALMIKVDKLPLLYRTLFLYYLEDYTLKDLANWTGSVESNICLHMQRVMRYLRGEYPAFIYTKHNTKIPDGVPKHAGPSTIKEKILDCYNEGLINKKVAEKCGCTKEYVSAVLSGAHLKAHRKDTKW